MIRAARIAAAIAAIALCLTLLASPAAAQSRQMADRCVFKDETTSPDPQIAACTAAINSGRWRGKDLAWAFDNRGRGYGLKGDLDRSIANFNEAIRLNPRYALAYQGRAETYYRKGDLDRAIADINEAIRLDPKYALSYNNRGLAYLHKGDLDRAIADFSEAIRRDPKSAGAYRSRGIANLYFGALPKALADFNQASELDQKDAYVALWLDIAGQRSNLPGRLAEAARQLDMTKWPAPIVRLYLGQLTPEAVLAAADDPDPKTKNGQVCEANFYTAQLALRRGEKSEAERLFRLAASDCPKEFFEWFPANAELKALEAAR